MEKSDNVQKSDVPDMMDDAKSSWDFERMLTTEEATTSTLMISDGTCGMCAKTAARLCLRKLSTLSI